ncbi:surfeit locus 1 family protein [Janthinobacterium sp. CG_23.3]|uniref:SURF1 family protein n=1 Tax=unclassified Janthinobacterium TaxID=2610881 RepID=UPI0003680815|nr:MULTISPECIES: SURF1 family protein [unclassified Janthinobacterium]MEC5160951.1 surfeit locus 1 family protein [Janthinobacterium sp. CG_S6]
MRIRFRFRWIPFVATLLVVALGVSLGQWQDRRAAQKTALQARLAAGNAAAPLALGPRPLAPAQVEFRRVAVSGQFVPGWALYLDNRPYQGRAGFYLLMPFKIAGSDQHVLVARGWLPRHSADRARLPVYATPAGVVSIEGIARLNAGHVMQLGTAAPLRPDAIVQNLDIGELVKASGLRLQPFIIEQSGAAAAGDALVRDWPAPALGVDKHRGYAFQWYALALMALLFFVFTGFRRGPN